MPAKKAPAVKNVPAAKTADPDVDMVRNLAHILNETGLTEIVLERKGTHFRVGKQATVMQAAAAAPAAAPHHHAAAAMTAPTASAPAAATAPGDHPGTIKSPMVGTVYRASSPGAANFVEPGATVKQGQTVLIIEAMKTMNQILAPKAGTVTQVFVENAQPVEFGEALLVIE